MICQILRKSEWCSSIALILRALRAFVLGFWCFWSRSSSINFTPISLDFFVLIENVISFMENYFVAIGLVNEEILRKMSFISYCK